jgi:hypothetical protein
MDHEAARRLIAIAISSRKDHDSISRQDMIKELSFKRRLLSTESVNRLIEASLKEGLVQENDGNLKPNFTVSGISVPLDFSVNEKDLFSENSDKPLSERLLDFAVNSGNISKKDAIKIAGDFLKTMKFLDFETALMIVLSDRGIDIRDFAKEII